MSRPKKVDGRTENVNIRLTKSEYDEACRRASLEDITVSDLFRDGVFVKQKPPDQEKGLQTGREALL